MGFMKDYGMKILFKGIALVALWFLFMVYSNNFEVCNSVQGIACKGKATIENGVVVIPLELRCADADSDNCCVTIYEDNPQCYLTALRQSVFAGIMGCLLMLFAEAFFIVAFIVYKLFPFLVKFVIYGGRSMGDPGEAAMISTDVFAKAIYLITPVLLGIIFYTLYNNLPYFI